MWSHRRVEFLVVALAGLLVGAGLGAARTSAPRWVRVGFFLLGGVTLTTALALVVAGR
jgi:hypothetical protein